MENQETHQKSGIGERVSATWLEFRSMRTYAHESEIECSTTKQSKFKFVVRRNGTSMISLIIPPKDQISRVSKMLADEFGTASNIKSRVNRLSVLGAITSVQHRLKLYTKGMYQMLAPCEPVTKCKGLCTTFFMDYTRDTSYHIP
jgi:hypothetical protein